MKLACIAVQIEDEAASATRRGLNRLDNWRRWAQGGEARDLARLYYPGRAAVCGDYKRTSAEFGMHDDDIHDYPVDVDDAVAVDAVVLAMPMHLNRAVRFWFMGRPKIERVAQDVIRGWVEHAARYLEGWR